MKKTGLLQYMLYVFIILGVCITSPSVSFSEENAGQSEIIVQKEVTQDTENNTAEDSDTQPKLKTASASESSEDLSILYVIKPDIVQQAGAATINYPVELPAGTNDLTPQVRLHYSSYKRNGLVGTGWDLNIDTIKRSIKHGVDYDGTDFIYNRMELVPVEVDGNGYGTYRQKRENEFAIIKYKSDGSWSVTLKDGAVYRYGTDDSSKQKNGDDTFQWFLKSVTDTNGNEIRYTYTSQTGQVYPETISYADYYTVSFYYEDRDDSFLSYASSSEIKTSQRLKTIAVSTDTKNIQAHDLVYEYSNDTKRSILSEIKCFGSDFQLNSGKKIFSGSSLPSTKFEYYKNDKKFDKKFKELGNYSVNEMTGDWNGDGKTDIVLKLRFKADDRGYYFYTSDGKDSFDFVKRLDFYGKLITGDWNGDGKTDYAVEKTKNNKNVIEFYLAVKPESNSKDNAAFASTYFTEVEGQLSKNSTGDWNGDGKTDLCVKNYKTYKFYLSTGSKFNSYANMDKFHLQLTGDWNGDGKTDLLAKTDNKNSTLYHSTGSGFLSFATVNDKVFKFVGDWNGDGKDDFSFWKGSWKDRKTCFYLSTGSKSKPVVLYKTLSGEYFPFGDVNGDGIIDYGKERNDKSEYFDVYYFSNSDSNHFSKIPIKVHNASELAVVFPGRFRGTEKVDLAVIHSTYKSGRISVISSKGEKNIDLISRITPPSGSVSQIDYTSSSDYENIQMPFPVQTVSEITTNDGLGNTSTTSFSYSGGMYDYEERELRSFECVTKTNPDGTVEKTLFHQDKFMDGLPVKTKHKTSDDTLLSKTEYTWQSTPDEENNSSFVRMTDKTTTVYANTAEQATDAVESREEYDYDDDHGSITKKIVSGSGLSEKIITGYDYDYFGSGNTYPLRKTKETLKGSETSIARQTEFGYEIDTGNMLTERRINTSGDDCEISYLYDTYGNVTQMTDAMGNITTYEYDPVINTHVTKTARPDTGHTTVETTDPETGEVTQEIQSDHHVTERTVNFLYGKPSKVTDENGNDTEYEYDVFGRTEQVKYPDGGEERYEYDDTSMPRRMTKSIKENDYSWIKTVTYFDGLERTVQTVSGSMDAYEEKQYAVSLFTFDNMGREEIIKGPFFNRDNQFMSDHFSKICSNPDDMENGIVSTWSKHSYDGLGRIISTEQSGDITTSFSYSGIDITETDPDTCQTTRTTDILDRTTKIIEHGPQDHETLYAYNAASDLLEISRTGSEIKNTFTFNTLGRKTSETDPDRGHLLYKYDRNGNITEQTDARNIKIRYQYDELNRLVKKTCDNKIRAEYKYDAGTNGMGLLYEKSNDRAATKYISYDKMGKLLSESVEIGDQSIKFDYAWDLAGRQIQKKMTENGTVFKTLLYDFYPETNLLKSVQLKDENTTTDLYKIDQYSPSGKMMTMTGGNNTLTNHLYDNATGRLTILYATEGGSGAQDIADRYYEYSKAGDIVLIEDTVAGKTRTYAYDHMHRLLSEQEEDHAPDSGGNTPEEPGVTEPEEKTVHTMSSYSYDAFGRITEIDYPGDGGKTTFTYSITGPFHAPSSVKVGNEYIALTYTASGVRSKKGETAYSSDYDNMITQVKIGGRVTYFDYDADSQRVRKLLGDTDETLYFGNDFEIINDTPVLYAFAGNLRVARITGTGTTYYHKDHLGSTIAMSDSNGKVTQSGEYRPYGGDRGNVSLAGPYRFTDQEKDYGTGLYNYDARLYDPAIGQFIMPDTIIPDMYNPQALNRYAYCLNNPLKYTDPTGHFFKVFTSMFKVGRALFKGGNAWSTFSGIARDTKTIFSRTATFGSRMKAAGSLAWDVSGGKDIFSGGKYVFKAGKKALGVLKTTKIEKDVADNFFTGTKYTNKVLKQIKQGDFHSFPKSVEGFQNYGKIIKITGGDGVTRKILKIPGEYKGKKGMFEFIKEADGTINHRFFRPNPRQ